MKIEEAKTAGLENIILEVCDAKPLSPISNWCTAQIAL